MQTPHKNDVKVKVATRSAALSDDAVMLGGVLLLVLVNVVVLIGRGAGGM